MGDGFVCRCTRCRYEFNAAYGVGFNYPSVYREVLQEARQGRYGKATADFLKAHPDAAIDAEECAYICPKCGNLDCEPNLCLYLKKEGVEPPKDDAPWCIANPAEGVEFVDPSDLREYYKCGRVYRHMCKKCNSRMKQLTYRILFEALERHELSCPECGAELGFPEMLMWD